MATAARSSDSGYNDKASDKYALRIFSVENTTTIAQIKAAIDYAKANKVWLVLLVHEVLALGVDLHEALELDR